MALMRLGSKSDAFQLQGQTWVCANGLPSDITIEIGQMSFKLHKFPLLSRSGLLEKLIEELPLTSENPSSSPILNLDEIPGGPKAFELISKFCYDVKIELTCINVVSLRCAAEFLRMTEDYGEGNLILQTENFLNEVFCNWEDCLRALETCERVVAHAEELHIIYRLIDSLATKACTDSNFKIMSKLPLSSSANSDGTWNGIPVGNKVASESRVDDWWFEDTSKLNLSLYKQFILAIQSKGMKPETIAASIIHYSHKHLPLVTNGKNSTSVSDSEQKGLLEEIVTLLPYKKGVSSPKFLLQLLRIALALHSSPICRENLEKRVGAELDQAQLVDLLIPNIGYSAETLYDIDCVQRIVEHFMSLQQETVFSPCIVEENQLGRGAETLTPATTVASLVDGFLAEIAPDVNLKPQKFEALAAAVPDYARPVDDGVYHAVDIYLKARPWLTDVEREQLCRLVNCQKLSLEASTHAAQNERLPLRVIVQVLFFEQLRLRTSVSGWFFVSDNLQNPNGNNGKDMKELVADIEKECSAMKQDIQRLMKSKNKWKLFSKRFSFRRQKLHPCNDKKSCDFKEPVQSITNGFPDHQNADHVSQ